MVTSDPYDDGGNTRKPDILKLHVVHDDSCIPIFHPKIRDTQNK